MVPNALRIIKFNRLPRPQGVLHLKIQLNLDPRVIMPFSHENDIMALGTRLNDFGGNARRGTR